MPKRRSKAWPSRAGECRPTLPAIVLSGRPLRQQRARRVEPQALDEMRRRLAGGLGELAIEAALRQAGARRQRRHVERLVEIVLHPVDQRGERRLGRGLRLQQRAELRLVARPPGIEHEVPRDQVGRGGAEVGLDQGQRHVDAGRDAGRRPDLAVDDVERIGIDLERREVPSARRSQLAQCVATRLPSRSPAAASTKAPVQTEP